MQKKSHKDAACPTARAMERVGDTWSVLILREAFYGATRFDEFEKRLGIAPNMLTRRLAVLINEGLLTRRPYSSHPPRDEYLLTERGRDFRPVLLALMDWGDRHFSDQTGTVQVVDRRTGRPVRIALVDADTGQRITDTDHYIAAGPAASPELRARLERSSQAPVSAPLQTAESTPLSPATGIV